MALPRAKTRSGLLNMALLIVIVWGVIQSKPFLLPLCLAALVAFLLAPLVRWFTRRHLPEWLAIMLSVIILGLPIVGLGFALIHQGQAFLAQLPDIIHSASDSLERFSLTEIGKRLGLSTPQGPMALSTLLTKLTRGASEGIALVLGGLTAILNAGSELLLVILFAVLMLAEREHLHASADRIFQAFGYRDAPRLIEDGVELIQRFLVARMVILAVIGGLSGIALQFAGLRYAFLLGAFVGLMTLVPAVGFLISLIPVLIVALATDVSLPRSIVAFALLLVLNILDNYGLTPKLVGHRLGLNPLSTFLGILAGGLVWGVWGMFLSVPILGIVRIIMAEVPTLQPIGDLLASKPFSGEQTEQPPGKRVSKKAA